MDPGVSAMTTPGPIFLDRLLCEGEESSLLDCRHDLKELGLTNCDHSQDVWVKCKGTKFNIISRRLK